MRAWLLLLINYDLIFDLHLQEQLFNELGVLRKETRRLQLSMRRYTGEDLSSIPYEDLDELEQELERSVNKVRERKVSKLITNVNCSLIN